MKFILIVVRFKIQILQINALPLTYLKEMPLFKSKVNLETFLNLSLK